MTRRIVHVSSVHPATDPRIFEKECNSLAASGFDVRLVATGQAPASADFPVDALPRSTSRALRMLTGGVRAIRHAVRQRPDLVHLHDPELIPFVPLLRARGIQVVFDSHEDIPSTMLRKPYLRPAARRAMTGFGWLLVRLVDRYASGVVVATPAIGQRFRRAPLCLVQNFPILEDWRIAESAPTAPRLVFVGGISEIRGIWKMMDAIAILGPRHGARLVLAGTINDALLARLRRHAAWEHTDYLGILDRSGVADLLSKCSIGVVLFQPDPNHVESQPTKIFEYMAAGLPVLGSDFELWRRLVVDHGIGVLADPTDMNAIVAAAERIIADPEEARAMGRRGRDIVEKTRNWRVESERLVGFYRQLLGVG